MKLKIKCVCKICGNIFFVYPFRVNHKVYKNIYCGKECQSIGSRTGKILKCKICGKSFFAHLSRIKTCKNIYCSRKCMGIGQRIGKFFKCQSCGKQFYKSDSEIRRRNIKCCSIKCSGELARKRIIRKCLICGNEFGVVISRSKESYRGKYCSRKCWEISIKGEKSRWWKGGKSKSYESFRRKHIYREWRKKILIRDNYTCQKCGIKAETGDGVLLHAHHIKSYKLYPSLRTDVSNGITLCGYCHEKLHERKFPIYLIKNKH